jgi:UDP-glucose 4-epimerase
MNIVITGSAGRVGSKLARRLLDEGHHVTGFDLRVSGIEHAAYREVLGAFHDRAIATDAMRDSEAVVHLGALMSWIKSDVDRLFEANVEGTRVVLESAIAAKTSRFVFASSGEVYPEGAPQRLPITEDHPLEPRSAYGVTKLLGEELVRYFGRVAGLQFTILRFSHTQDAAELLDPDSFFSGPRFFLRPRIRQQEAFGNHAAVAALKAKDDGRESLLLSRNENGRPFRMQITETRDMVDGVLLALRSPAAIGETFNLGNGIPVDFGTLTPRLAERTGLPVVSVDLPGPGVYFETSTQKFRERLKFEPAWPIERMFDEAEAAWRQRRGGLAK